jgi:outer membrane protein assembly factor BamB
VTRVSLCRAPAFAVLLAIAACGSSAVGASPTSGQGAGASHAGMATASDVPSQGRRVHVPDGDWTRFDFNAQRTGVGPARTGITRATLHTLRRRTINIDGTVDSSAIQLHAVRVRGRRRDVIIVTTTYGRTLAIDANSGKRLWQFSPKDIGAFVGGAEITTASPAADPDRKFIYAASPDGYIHKLSVATGRSRWATRVTFDATHEKIASALNISGRWVLATTGGYIGDAPSYQGHVVLIDRRSGHLAHVWNSLCSHRAHLIHPPSSCSASDSAIWGRSGAVVEPGSGRILVATGNAPFNGSTNWGDSTVELSPTLKPLRHWTPRNQQELGQGDTDLGSTSPAILPGGLAVQGGKAGILSLLRLSRLSRITGAGGHHLGGELQNIDAPGQTDVFTAPAVWRQAKQTYLFVSTGGGTWAYVLRRARLQIAWRSGTPGTSPIVAGGLLYVFDPGGHLDILSPTTGHELASLPAAGGHWNSPIVVGGRIILPVGDANAHATSGQLLVYHLPGR